MPFAAIAAKMRTSEASVRRRVKRLVDQDAFAVTAVADPRVLGAECMAWTALTVRPAEASRIAESLVALPQIDYVVQTSGRFAVMAELVCRDSDELRAVLGEIRAVPGVQRSETFVYLAVLHQQFVWGGDDGPSRPVVGPGTRDLASALLPTDAEIVRQLQVDGRLPFRTVAARLNVSERMVAERYRWLVERGFLRVMAVGNPEPLGFDARCWLGVCCEPGLDGAKVALELAAVRGIDYVVTTTGRYDLMAELVCRERDELLHRVEADVGSIAGIDSVEGFYYLRVLYHSSAGAWAAGRAQEAALGRA